jgi:hypothetical protein
MIGLTDEEDAELRRLVFLAQFAQPGERIRRRIIELRVRDRRAQVRDPKPTDLLPWVPEQRTDPSGPFYGS